MAPPPPSASYLLVLDSDTESEDEERCVVEVSENNKKRSAVEKEESPEAEGRKGSNVEKGSDAYFAMVAKIKADLARATGLPVETFDKSKSNIDKSSIDKSREEEEDKRKKKKNRKKKKKKKKEQQQQPKLSKSVSFGEVNVREYQRTMSEDAVPADGGWPLGIGDDVVNEFSLHTETFEERRQQELQQRYAALLQEKNIPKAEDQIQTTHLETRQFDYKKKITDHVEDPMQESRNPLFAALSEDQRMHLIRRDSDSSDKDYSSLHVKHVRNDLEQIRNNRSAQAATGCTCRKMHVFLPSLHANASSSKRTKSHRRMPERKVKEELRKRGLLRSSDKSLTREQFEQKLYDTVQQEPCCWGDECPCVHSGIGCQADTCSCWHPGHDNTSNKPSTHKKNTVQMSKPETIRTKCGNPHGMYVVDFDKIESHRQQFVYCQEVSSTDVSK